MDLAGRYGFDPDLDPDMPSRYGRVTGLYVAFPLMPVPGADWAFFLGVGIGRLPE